MQSKRILSVYNYNKLASTSASRSLALPSASNTFDLGIGLENAINSVLRVRCHDRTGTTADVKTDDFPVRHEYFLRARRRSDDLLCKLQDMVKRDNNTVLSHPDTDSTMS